MQQLHQRQCTQLPPTTRIAMRRSFCQPRSDHRQLAVVASQPILAPFFRRITNATEHLNVTRIAKSGEQSRPRLAISGSWRD